jgi:hypothetical protein
MGHFPSRLSLEGYFTPLRYPDRDSWGCKRIFPTVKTPNGTICCSQSNYPALENIRQVPEESIASFAPVDSFYAKLPPD